MWEVIRGTTSRKQDGKDSATRVRMAIAFIAGIVVTAALAYIPVITDIFSHELSQESAVPAPLDVPDFIKPGGPDSSPAKHDISELVYAPFKEGVFSG